MNTSRFFTHYYNNAEVNAIMIMDLDGNVLDVNKAFTANFGYSNEDIRGKNFSLFFNESDKENGKPQLELATVASKGQSLKDRKLVFDTQAVETKNILLNSKIIARRSGLGRTIFIIIEEV